MITSADVDRPAKKQRVSWPLGTELQLFVGGIEAVPKGNMRAFVPKGWTRAVITDGKGKDVRAYEGQVRNAVRVEMERRGLVCAQHQPFEVHLCFFRARAAGDFDRHGQLKQSARTTPWVKPDIDKLQRSVLDALTKLVFDDDDRVVRVVVEKRFADAQHDVGTWIRVRPLPATQRELADSQQRNLGQTGERP